MPALAEYSNVYGTCIDILQKKGWRCWYDRQLDVYCAEKDGWDFMGAVKDRGGVDEKGDDNEYVIKCPIRICGDSFVFGYAKKIVENGRTDDVFTENIDEALKFGSRRCAVKAAKKILPGCFDGIKNVVLVSDERMVVECT